MRAIAWAFTGFEPDVHVECTGRIVMVIVPMRGRVLTGVVFTFIAPVVFIVRVAVTLERSSLAERPADQALRLG